MCGAARNSGCSLLETFLAKKKEKKISVEGIHLAMMCLKKLKILYCESLLRENTNLGKCLIS